MAQIDYERARQMLEDVFTQVEGAFLENQPPSPPKLELASAFDILFVSRTQAYREVLLGCTVARLEDQTINVREPYSGHSSNAFSGRSLDERVINPFLQDKRIPCSRGPYLSVFRRSVRFDETTRSGLRDQEGYNALLTLLSWLEQAEDESRLRDFLLYLLYKFVELREASNVPLSRLQRISLEQYDELINGLLGNPSGGRIPVLLVVATFITLKEAFDLAWDIEWQGINVADIPSRSGGDITIKKDNEVILSAEVTERPVDRNRVVATFRTKIAPAAFKDYLFLVTSQNVDSAARAQAHQYFSQGHEVNFLEIKGWIVMILATIGIEGRNTFNKVLMDLFSGPDVPTTVKALWNEQVDKLTS